MAAPREVAGAAPAAGRLEPALRWLACCQGAWPPHRPAAVVHARIEAPGSGSAGRGRARADDAADRGADLLVVQGVGDPVEGLLVTAALLDLEPVRAVGTSGRADWVHRTVAVRDGLRHARAHRDDPARLLDAVGAWAVAEAAGLLAQSAVRRTPVLLDGSVLVGAAAVCADRLAPGARAWWLAGCASPVPAAAQAHRELGLPPLLDLDLEGPEGADMALSVLEQGCDLVRGARDG